VDRRTFIQLLQREITRHHFTTFVDGDGRSVAKGGQGVVVSGCAACRVKMQTSSQFLEHVAAGLPAWFEKTVPLKDH